MEACGSFKKTLVAGKVENTGWFPEHGCEKALGLDDLPLKAGTSEAAPRGMKVVRLRTALNSDFNIGVSDALPSKIILPLGAASESIGHPYVVLCMAMHGVHPRQ